MNKEIFRKEEELHEVWRLIRETEGKVVERGDYNINSTDEWGLNLLMHECVDLGLYDDSQRERNFNIIKKCVAEGVDVNAQVQIEGGWYGFTALKFACYDYDKGYEKSLDRIKLLISLGAKVSSDMKEEYPFLGTLI